MKKMKMRNGFTMIELVFVIVIIGILSAVALPKFLETSNQAHDATVKAFVGTLNRTVGPSMWSKSIAAGTNGVVIGAATPFCDTKANFEKFIDVPDELAFVAGCTFTIEPANGATVGSSISVVTNGDATVAPEWQYNPAP